MPSLATLIISGALYNFIGDERMQLFDHVYGTNMSLKKKVYDNYYIDGAQKSSNTTKPSASDIILQVISVLPYH